MIGFKTSYTSLPYPRIVTPPPPLHTHTLPYGEKWFYDTYACHKIELCRNEPTLFLISEKIATQAAHFEVVVICLVS